MTLVNLSPKHFEHVDATASWQLASMHPVLYKNNRRIGICAIKADKKRNFVSVESKSRMRGGVVQSHFSRAEMYYVLCPDIKAALHVDWYAVVHAL